MDSLNEDKHRLVRQLEKRGLGRNDFPGFIWSLKSCLVINPGLDCSQLNKRLQLMGWESVVLDPETLRLVVACYAAGGQEQPDVPLALCGA